jgi:hypothetical protein
MNAKIMHSFRNDLRENNIYYTGKSSFDHMVDNILVVLQEHVCRGTLFA